MSPRKTAPDPRDFVERATFFVVGFTLVAVPLLVFFFGFGNVGLLGVSLGIDRWIAFLTGPAVDLAATGCVTASSYLSAKGWTERQLWPLHVAAGVLGLIMLALNTGSAIYVHRWRLAAFDAVGPMLLLGWGALAPWLWRNLTEARRQGSASAPAANYAGTRKAAPVSGPALPAVPGNGSATLPPPARNQLPPLPPAASAPTRKTTAPEDGKVASLASAADSGKRRAELALPLWRQHVKATGKDPNAAELAALLRAAHPELPMGKTDRTERNIRAATKELVDAEADPERALAAS